jgi:hypothetical protein
MHYIRLLLLKCVAPRHAGDFDAPPQQLQSGHHFCTESFNIGINVTPKGSFVDLIMVSLERTCIVSILI